MDKQTKRKKTKRTKNKKKDSDVRNGNSDIEAFNFAD